MERLKLRKRKKSLLTRINGATWALLGVVAILTVIRLFAAFAGAEGPGLIVDILTWIAVLIVPFTFFGGLRKFQKLRDAEVALPGHTALYLRTFYSDKRVVILNPYYSVWSGALLGPLAHVFEPASFGPETFVARVLEPYIHVRQVEGGDTVSGPRFVATNLNWQSVVTAAAEDAEFIVVLPLISQEGETLHGKATLWEIGHLIDSDKMERAAVLMPPGFLFRTNAFKRNWQLAQQHAREHDLHLPDYDPRGCVLTFKRTPDGWREAARYGDKGGGKRKRFAQGLLDALQANANRLGIALFDPRKPIEIAKRAA